MSTTPTTHALLMRAAERAEIPCRVLPALWTSDDPRDQVEAVSACRLCPVIALCRAHIATSEEPAGVWAATTPRDRRRPHRARGAA